MSVSYTCLNVAVASAVAAVAATAAVTLATVATDCSLERVPRQRQRHVACNRLRILSTRRRTEVAAALMQTRLQLPLLLPLLLLLLRLLSPLLVLLLLALSRCSVAAAAVAAALRAAWSAWRMPSCSSRQTGTLRDSDLETCEDVLVPRAALLLGTPLETE